MKNPSKQNQHKLPQVYLRQFGYNKDGHWKVSIKIPGEQFSRQKSIESFMSEENVFKIESDEPKIQNIFEEFNCLLEDEYLKIIEDLDIRREFSHKSQAYLFQLIPNLLIRTDSFRLNVRDLLESDARKNFLTIICYHKVPDIAKLHESDFFRMLNEPPVDESIINKTLIFFADHIFRKLAWFEIVILKSQEDKPWYTSDNPVVFNNKMSKFNFFTDESEIYFPLNPKYLLYFHCKKSKVKNSKLRSYKSNKIHLVNDKDNWRFQKKILSNLDKLLIVKGEFKFKKL
jgi:hypothetical protein